MVVLNRYCVASRTSSSSFGSSRKSFAKASGDSGLWYAFTNCTRLAVVPAVKARLLAWCVGGAYLGSEELEEISAP